MHCMQRAIDAEMLRRDDLRQKQKLGELIDALSNKPPSHFNLSTLPPPIYDQVTDPRLIQQELNEYFNQWYALAENLDSAADRLA
jgi:hypothetical protein